MQKAEGQSNHQLIFAFPVFLTSLEFKAIMSKSTKPFRYRAKWRASLTLPNGLRPTKDFETYDDALVFLAAQRAIATDMNTPELGGPTQATLA